MIVLSTDVCDDLSDACDREMSAAAALTAAASHPDPDVAAAALGRLGQCDPGLFRAGAPLLERTELGGEAVDPLDLSYQQLGLGRCDFGLEGLDRGAHHRQGRPQLVR